MLIDFDELPQVISPRFTASVNSESQF